MTTHGTHDMDDLHHHFERLFRAHERDVRAYCARRLDSAAVDDAVAETFSVAWRKIDQLPVDASALPWLYGVAYRVIQHEWRSNGRRARLFRRSISVYERPHRGAGEELDEGEDLRTVIEAASRLPDDDQEILRLTLWEEITPTDAGVVLGITADAAKQRARRARKRLAEEFHRLSARPVTRPATTNPSARRTIP
jgi:RNA polymerase sigma-70 factor, ECF subfamily